MKINYELDEFSTSTIETITNHLRIEKIPHLIEGNQLLVDKSDEFAVDKILSEFGEVEQNQVITEDSNSAVKKPDWKVAYERDQLRRVEKVPSIPKPPKSQNVKETQQSSIFQTIGMVLGGIFGVAIVVAAFLDPTYEGRIYLFLPAIICAGVGLAIGMAVDRLVDTFRGQKKTY